MEIRTIGIDLGETVFHLVAVNTVGKVVVRKKCSRTQLLRFTSNLRQCLIGMEACGGSHFLGRALREQGHKVRLMPAQYVKPYVKTNKNDYIDVEAIAEAVTRPSMRFVPIKTDDQLDLQSLHRVRERWMVRRTAVINQMRGLLLERGSRYVRDAAILKPLCLDSGRRRQQAVRCLASPSDPASVGDAIPAPADRGIRQADRAHRRRTGTMQAPGSDPRNRTLNRHRHHRGHRQWSGLQEGPGVWRLAGSGARRTLHRRQAEADRYQQAGQQIPTKALHPGSAYGAAAEDQTNFRPEYVAGQSRIAQASSSGDSGLSQQDGTHGLGGSLQSRTLSPTTVTTDSCSVMACR